jgi:ribosomal protein S12 methylthiotransferase
MKADPRILPYFDIPFQSGSDPILRAMNRRHTAEENLALLATIRRTLTQGRGGIPVRVPVFRSTWLCGFPGESDADAEATAAFLETGRPLWSGCFTYSREEDTPASRFKNRVPAKLAQQRKAYLENLQERVTAEHLASFVGTEQTVLIEEILEKPPHSPDTADAEALNYALGRAWFQAPEVDGAVILPYDGETQNPLPGQTVRVRITGVSGVDLLANFA